MWQPRGRKCSRIINFWNQKKKNLLVVLDSAHWTLFCKKKNLIRTVLGVEVSRPEYWMEPKCVFWEKYKKRSTKYKGICHLEQTFLLFTPYTWNFEDMSNSFHVKNLGYDFQKMHRSKRAKVKQVCSWILLASFIPLCIYSLLPILSMAVDNKGTWDDVTIQHTKQ